MKRFYAIALAGLIAVSSFSAFAATTGPSVKINGSAITFSAGAEPFIDSNNRTLVPLRFISDNLAATTDWDNTAKTATIKSGETTIKVTLNSNVVEVDGVKSTIDTAAVIKNNVTFVPLSFVSKALGAEVNFDSASKTVEISKGLATGDFVGYAWGGQKDGTKLEDAGTIIETKLNVANGIIKDAEMNYWQKSGDNWVKRNDGVATAAVDFTKDPISSTDKEGGGFTNGTSMFTTKATNNMGLYAVAVDTDGTTGVMLVDATSRFRFEAKIPADFDFSTKIGDLKINDFWIPVAASTSGYVKPATIASLNDTGIYDIQSGKEPSYVAAIGGYNYVMHKRGILEGVDNTATLQTMLEKLGVKFVDGKPQAMEATAGFHSVGGWKGNYDSIANFLKGKSIYNHTALVDFDKSPYKESIDANNFFGNVSTDVVASATRSIQNSWNIDAASGATVRVSRESESYQRALVDAGVLTEDQVIKGRF